MAEKTICCPKCKKPFSYRVPRAAWVKSLLFFLPIRRYFCSVCFTKRHVIYRHPVSSTVHKGQPALAK